MAHSRIPVSLVAVPTLILSDSQDLPFTRSFIENVTKALHGKVWKATNVSKSDMLTWLMNKEGPWTSKRLFLAVFQHKFSHRNRSVGQCHHRRSPQGFAFQRDSEAGLERSCTDILVILYNYLLFTNQLYYCAYYYYYTHTYI